MAEIDDILRRAYGDREALREPSLQYSGNPWGLAPEEPTYRHEAKPTPGIGDPFARGGRERPRCPKPPV